MSVGTLSSDGQKQANETENHEQHPMQMAFAKEKHKDMQRRGGAIADHIMQRH